MSQLQPSHMQEIAGLVRVLGQRMELVEPLAHQLERQISSLIEEQLADMAEWVGRTPEEIRSELHIVARLAASGLTGRSDHHRMHELQEIPTKSNKIRSAILADSLKFLPRTGQQLQQQALTALRIAVNERIARYYQEARLPRAD